MGRFYEWKDCLEPAIVNSAYKIVQAYITANGCGDCDVVYGFGNPQTRNLVWIPYFSKISIAQKPFQIVRPQSRPYEGDRGDVRDLSTRGLYDGTVLVGIDNYMGQTAILTQINESRAINAFNAFKDVLEGRVRLSHNDFERRLLTGPVSKTDFKLISLSQTVRAFKARFSPIQK